jgi:RimJ/RimL family protein N-acetyltransferase
MVPGSVVTTYESKKTHTVTIRYLSPGDFENLFSYVNAIIAEDTTVMLSGEPMTRSAEQAYVQTAVGLVEQGKKIHIVACIGEELVGSAEVRRFDKRKSHVGEIGISVAKGYRDEGIGRMLMETLLSEAKAMKLRMLYLHCFETNESAIRLYESCGFKKAGIVPGMLSYKGTYVGELTMYCALVSL